MEHREFAVLQARVERLERRMRVVVAGWVLSVAVFVLLGVAVQQAVSQPEVLRAQRIEVVDAAGRVRIVLAVLPDGTPGLNLSTLGCKFDHVFSSAFTLPGAGHPARPAAPGPWRGLCG